MVILGIDLGLRICGYVVCKIENLKANLIKENEIKPDHRQPLPQKLSYIYEELKKEINLYKPKVIVAEKLYSHYRHPVTLGLLSQVKGIIALLAYQEKIDFFDFSPTSARKSFIGRGNVNSMQVKKMAENITGQKIKSVHTADAFSLVIAFVHLLKLQRLMKNSKYDL